MRKVAWTILRNLESVRESVASTLKDGAIDRGNKKSDEFFVDWLRNQGVNPFFHRYVDDDRMVLSMLSTMENALEEKGVNLLSIKMAGTYSRFNEPDIGTERSSSGWMRLPNFITSSALIRLLGAMEQFEMDVLKALLFYRPQGKEHDCKLEYQDVDLAVILEEPDSDGRYAKPAIWSWLKRSAENSVERRKIFKSVFDIDCFPSKFGNKSSADIKRYYQALYEKRNGLAHGRSLVEVTLSDYCEAEAYVLALVVHLSSACEDRYRLGI